MSELDILAKDRLIVALDVPTKDAAIRLVEELNDQVSFFKVGWLLFLSGGLEDLLKDLRARSVFVDLKLPDDIGQTIQNVMRQICSNPVVKFLTLTATANLTSIHSAREAKQGAEYPKLLSIPLLSSLDGQDIQRNERVAADDLDGYIMLRARAILDAGCDGLIASGDSIAHIRKVYKDTLIVSPGIRPTGFSSDDHKRFTTPFDAIRMGANYIVVGRPILNAPDPAARKKIIKSITSEIERALEAKSSPSNSKSENAPDSITRGFGGPSAPI